jgi:hemolysin activation/secretion protein
MGSHKYKLKIWLTILSVIFTVDAIAQLDLPDSSRPGAVRPEDVGRRTVPESRELPSLPIPPVIDRPFETDAGDVVVVIQFRLLDARNLPDLDISLNEIQQILEAQIAARPEGFTIGQLQEAADEVTRYYRENGLILAQAVIPVQTVQSGIVEIQIYEGKLDRVLTEGNKYFSSRILERPFRKLIGKPVTNYDIESALLTLTDYPGLSVFGVFQPGRQVGTADIVLRVQQEKFYDVSLRADNHGLQNTGRARFRPVVEWNNPTRGADKIAVTMQQTYKPKNNIFYAVDYERHLGYGLKLAAGFNRNEFDVGGELKRQNISGLTENIGASLQKQWIRSRQYNLATELSLTHKASKTFLRDRITNHDKLSVLGVGVTFDNVDIRFKGINFIELEYSHGFNDFLGSMGSNADALLLPSGSRPGRRGNDNAGRAFAEGQFSKIFASAMRLQTLPYNFNLLARTEFQWSDDLLVPLEQYAVGGPDHVRAYPQTQQLLDRALFGSIELSHPIPFITGKQAFANRTWGELVSLAVFYDHAIGRLNKPISTDPQRHANFKGAGFQAQLIWQGILESRFIVAWPMGGKYPPENERNPQLWGDFTFRF